jgi:hypothetical protein
MGSAKRFLWLSRAGEVSARVRPSLTAGVRLYIKEQWTSHSASATRRATSGNPAARHALMNRGRELPGYADAPHAAGARMVAHLDFFRKHAPGLRERVDHARRTAARRPDDPPPGGCAPDDGQRLEGRNTPPRRGRRLPVPVPEVPDDLGAVPRPAAGTTRRRGRPRPPRGQRRRCPGLPARSSRSAG